MIGVGLPRGNSSASASLKHTTSSSTPDYSRASSTIQRPLLSMRTSRPLKHAPIPLLKDNSANQSSKKGSKVKGKGKGRGKSTADEEEDSLINNEVYSYAPENRGRGIKQAARRLRGARESLSASNAESELRGRGSKGRKAKEGSDGEEGEDDDGDDEDDEFGQDVNDLRGINFKLGAGSDDDDDGLEGGAGFDSEDDEEIDSDLAGTDSEEESAEDDARPRSSKSAGVQQGKKKSRRQVRGSRLRVDFILHCCDNTSESHFAVPPGRGRLLLGPTARNRLERGQRCLAQECRGRRTLGRRLHGSIRDAAR